MRLTVAHDQWRKTLRLGLIALSSVLGVTPSSAGAVPPPSKASGIDGGSHPVQSIARPGMITGPEASDDGRRLVNWVVDSGDNLQLPYIVIDKVRAEVLAFGANGDFRGRAPVLIGVGRGDISPVGIGRRRLADIAPSERITPAGRFIAALGRDLGVKDVLWVDYEAGISLHRVATGNVSERRLKRLQTATNSDNRISYGCINVPVKFFDSVIQPMFKGTNGIVYILPDSSPLSRIFPSAASSKINRAKS